MCRARLVSGIDMEHLASLVAPRAQIILIAIPDPLRRSRAGGAHG